jgi:hypothetical protein
MPIMLTMPPKLMLSTAHTPGPSTAHYDLQHFGEPCFDTASWYTQTRVQILDTTTQSSNFLLLDITAYDDSPFHRTNEAALDSVTAA